MSTLTLEGRGRPKKYEWLYTMQVGDQHTINMDSRPSMYALACRLKIKLRVNKLGDGQNAVVTRTR
jgi:hypothetical protein